MRTVSAEVRPIKALRGLLLAVDCKVTLSVSRRSSVDRTVLNEFTITGPAAASSPVEKHSSPAFRSLAMTA